MSIFEKDVTYQYIGNVANGATDGTTKAEDIAAGSVAIVDSSNTVEENSILSSDSKYRIVQKLANGKLVYSPYFKGSQISVEGKEYVASTEQVSYLGYNTTSGSLGTIAVDDLLTLSVYLHQTSPVVNNTPLVKTIPFKAQAATQENASKGLLESFDRQFAREPYPMIKAERVYSGALTELTNDTTVTNGSKTVASDGHGLTAGDIVSLRDIAYVVTSATTNEFVLDTPYKGDTETIVVASTVDQAASAAAGGDWGIKFTGLNRFASVGFDPVTDTYSKVRFTISADGFDSSVSITEDTEATEGEGTYYQVANQEIYSAMNSYAGRYVQAYPPTKYRTEADDSTTYDTLVLNATDSNYTSATTGINPKSLYTMIIRLDSTLTGDAVDTALGESFS